MEKEPNVNDFFVSPVVCTSKKDQCVKLALGSRNFHLSKLNENTTPNAIYDEINHKTSKLKITEEKLWISRIDVEENAKQVIGGSRKNLEVLDANISLVHVSTRNGKKRAEIKFTTILEVKRPTSVKK